MKFPEIFAKFGKTQRTATYDECLATLNSSIGPENWEDEYEPIGALFGCKLKLRFPDGSFASKCGVSKRSFRLAFRDCLRKWGFGQPLETTKEVPLPNLTQAVKPADEQSWKPITTLVTHVPVASLSLHSKPTPQATPQAKKWRSDQPASPVPANHPRDNRKVKFASELFTNPPTSGKSFFAVFKKYEQIDAQVNADFTAWCITTNTPQFTNNWDAPTLQKGIKWLHEYASGGTATIVQRKPAIAKQDDSKEPITNADLEAFEKYDVDTFRREMFNAYPEKGKHIVWNIAKAAIAAGAFEGSVDGWLEYEWYRFVAYLRFYWSDTFFLLADIATSNESRSPAKAATDENDA